MTQSENTYWTRNFLCTRAISVCGVVFYPFSLRRSCKEKQAEVKQQLWKQRKQKHRCEDANFFFVELLFRDLICGVCHAISLFSPCITCLHISYNLLKFQSLTQYQLNRIKSWLSVVLFCLSVNISIDYLALELCVACQPMFDEISSLCLILMIGLMN